MRPVEAFVAVGSNVEPCRHIPLALERLMERVRVLATSTFYRTPALGRPEHTPFLNGVWRIATLVPPRTLKFEILRAIEAELGRIRTKDKFAPRPIDLDLVLHGDVVLDEPGLRIPDPDIGERAFIAAPMLELAPDLVLPDTGARLASLPSARVTRDMEADAALTAQLRKMLAPSD